jgi:hypothetical protein
MHIQKKIELKNKKRGQKNKHENTPDATKMKLLLSFTGLGHKSVLCRLSFMVTEINI